MSNCKVFVGGLAYSTTDESLAAYFSTFGSVKEATVMRTHDGQSRGFGFCVFQSNRVCQRVIKTKTHVIDNRRVDVRWALSKDEAPPPQSSIHIGCINNVVDDGATKLNLNKVFVGGLHFQTTQDDLIKYFSAFGDVESGSVVYNHENHKSRGFGFIIFKDPSGVQKAMAHPDHVILGRHVEVKRAIPKQTDSSEVVFEKTPVSVTSPVLEGSAPPKSAPDSLQNSIGPFSTYSLRRDTFMDDPSVSALHEVYQEPEGLHFSPALSDHYHSAYQSEVNSADNSLHSSLNPAWTRLCSSDNTLEMKYQPLQDCYQSNRFIRDDPTILGLDHFKDLDNNEDSSLYSLILPDYEESLPVGEGPKNSLYRPNFLRSSYPYTSSYEEDRVGPVRLRSSGNDMPFFYK